MNRSEMYKVVRANYVPGNARFLDTDGKFHNFGSAHSEEGVFQFSENREDETPMPRHHLCSMLELEEGDDPQCGSYPVMIKTDGIHGKYDIREIRGYYMAGNDLVFTEAINADRPISEERRIIKLELGVEELRWLKNRVVEKLEFYSKCTNINYTRGQELGKSVLSKMETAEWGEVFGD